MMQDEYQRIVVVVQGRGWQRYATLMGEGDEREERERKDMEREQIELGAILA